MPAMTLHKPFKISSRLLPALHLGGAWVHLEYSPRPGNGGRVRYRYFIDIGDYEYSSGDLQSGCGGGSLQEGFRSLLSLLGACGEAHDYRERTGSSSDNIDLFPQEVAEWASRHGDEISILACEIGEGNYE